MFYPPKGDTQYLTRGPFVFTYVLFCVRKRIFDIQKRSMEYADFENFEILKCFIYGWVDGWMDGWMGYQKCPSMFFLLWVYRTCIRLLVCILKNFHQHSYGFQNLM